MNEEELKVAKKEFRHKIGNIWSDVEYRKADIYSLVPEAKADKICMKLYEIQNILESIKSDGSLK